MIQNVVLRTNYDKIGVEMAKTKITKSIKKPPVIKAKNRKSLWSRLEDDEKKSKLSIFMQLNPTCLEVASFFGVAESTISSWIRKEFQCGYDAFRSYHLTDVKLRLTGKAIKMAESGEKTMLKFALQNLCDWTEKSKVDATQISMLLGEAGNLSDSELNERLKECVE